MVELSEQYGSLEEYQAAAEEATSRGEEFVYDTALLQELIERHPGFIALVEREVRRGRK